MSEQGRCKTCRWWEEDKDDMATFRDGRCGSCLSDKIVYAGIELPSDAASYEDYEDYNANFFTGPDFGCIHWEPKD